MCSLFQCLGDDVFPIITIIAIIMFGPMTYFNPHIEKTLNVINTDSNTMAFVTNLGLPIGIPKISITTIENKTTVIVLCSKCTIYKQHLDNIRRTA